MWHQDHEHPGAFHASPQRIHSQSAPYNLPQPHQDYDWHENQHWQPETSSAAQDFELFHSFAPEPVPAAAVIQLIHHFDCAPSVAAPRQDHR